ncbi:MAG: hypothetical protein KIT61_10630 [Pyrinomonadaceae bacterium]|nr:hypothetical protein [Pyrinomonadaceae bacterium]
MNAAVRWFGGASVLLALLLPSAGCGGEARVAAADLGGDAGATLVASQDRLPPMDPSLPGPAVGDEAVAALSHDACRSWIATTCTQASLRSEAICRLARCEQVAGFWVVQIPHAQVEEDLRRRGY